MNDGGEARRRDDPFGLWRASAWAERDLPPALIEDVLCEGDLAMLYGAAGIGKSFVALDLAFRFANGESWCGHATRRGSAIYVAAEGQAGLRKRIRAWREKNPGRPGEPWILPRSVNLFMPPRRDGQAVAAPDVTELCKRLAKLPEPPKLIVFDTLASCAGGADENSSRDAGLMIAEARRLIEQYGCAVVLIHHEGKNQKRGARGSSAFAGAVDVKIAVGRDKNTIGVVWLTCEKAKDLPPFEPIEQHIVSVALDAGTTSAVVEWHGGGDVAQGGEGDSGRRIASNAQRPRKRGERHVAALALAALRMGSARRADLERAAKIPAGSFNRVWRSATERGLLLQDEATQQYALDSDLRDALLALLAKKRAVRLLWHGKRALHLASEDFPLTETAPDGEAA